MSSRADQAAPKLSEAFVQERFVAWLKGADWITETSVRGPDVLASRGDEVLIAEVKGHTAAPGLDVDTMYGQLLRRMTAGSNRRYAVVAPATLERMPLRVPAFVRDTLHIDIYLVDTDGQVTLLDVSG